jgi:two-component system, chemotaxis family, CheB/CheR fusion protein
MNSPQRDEKFEALLEYLQRTRGSDFTGYKRPSLMRRVSKRMQIVGHQDFGDYLDYLEVHPEEFTQLFNTILINVTGFFRDQAAWEYLGREVIPRILTGKKADEPIRAWSAGCASGEEAYTLAMVLAEALGLDAFRRRVKVYATDVDEEALTQARQANYPLRALQSLPPELKEKYLEPLGSCYVFRPDLRRAVIFGRHDLVQDAPISHLDLLVCRNVLMYFNAETQTRILARFHFALNDDGILFLGKAELLLTHANLFGPLDLRWRIFAKMPKLSLRDRLLLQTQAGDVEGGNNLTRQVRLREVSFDAAPVAQVVVDLNGHLALANERARSLFGLNLRDPGRAVFSDLELSYRPVELRSMIEQAYAERLTVARTNVERQLADGALQYLDVLVQPLQDNGGLLLGVSITFTDVSPFRRLQQDLERSTHELETAYEELQSTNEELETTNEELQSTVEELETTNEELQSTNEELETMNEELQSTNEELQTINEELRRRTAELNRTNTFLQSILTSLRTAVVVIDRAYSTLIWNHRAEDLWGLRSDEVQGQSFMNLDVGLPIAPLRGPIRACILGETDHQDVVLDATTRRGRAVRCRVTCTPLVNPEGERQGAILLMEEVSNNDP